MGKIRLLPNGGFSIVFEWGEGGCYADPRPARAQLDGHVYIRSYFTPFRLGIAPTGVSILKPVSTAETLFQGVLVYSTSSALTDMIGVE